MRVPLLASSTVRPARPNRRVWEHCSKGGGNGAAGVVAACGLDPCVWLLCLTTIKHIVVVVVVRSGGPLALSVCIALLQQTVQLSHLGVQAAGRRCGLRSGIPTKTAICASGSGPSAVCSSKCRRRRRVTLCEAGTVVAAASGIAAIASDNGSAWPANRPAASGMRGQLKVSRVPCPVVLRAAEAGTARLLQRNTITLQHGSVLANLPHKTAAFDLSGSTNLCHLELDSVHVALHLPQLVSL
mmetsp:Transcript_87492/g.203538  ORF Transcript_87492/g.203538 Transcript_87492/m.203538 type:complete len:242 (+) Transcript_87492:671-1396(+)